MPRSDRSRAWGAGLGAIGALLLVGWLVGPPAAGCALLGGLGGWWARAWLRPRRLPPSDREAREVAQIPPETRDLLRRLEAGTQIQSGRRLEALGHLTGGVAHDFNNLLTAIGTSTALLREELGPEGSRDEALELVGLVDDAARRASSLTRKLLSLGRSEEGPEELEVDDFLVGFAELLRRTLGGGVEVVEALEVAGVTVRADRAELELALLNLAVNARDAMPGGGRLVLGSRRLPPRSWPAGDRSPRPGVELRVEDSGMGMTEEVRRRAFDPFFTTKPRGEGSGLGLSAVAHAVQAMNGVLELESAPGRGTRVRIALPAVDAAEVTPLQLGGGPFQAARLEGKVLVVAAEGPVRRALIVQLRDLGLTARAVALPQDALERMQSERYDVVVSTETKVEPGAVPMDKVMRVAVPGIPVVLLTDEPAPSGPSIPGVVRLAYPVETKTLRRTLLRALNPGLPLPSESEERPGQL